MLPGTSGSDKTGSAFETLTVGAGPEDGPVRQEVEVMVAFGSRVSVTCSGSAGGGEGGISAAQG